MVCRNASTQKSRDVNPLIISTPEEQKLFDLGERMLFNFQNCHECPELLETEMNQRRQSTALKSLSKVPPSSSEAAELHAFYLQHGQYHGDGVNPAPSTNDLWMGDTILEKCMLMFPQERKCVVSSLIHPTYDFSDATTVSSVHQKIFGGYLMRLAYEVISDLLVKNPLV